MASSASITEPKLAFTLCPLPSTRRGYGVRLSSTIDGSRIVYGSGRLVVMRDIDSPSQCLIFSEHKANVTVAVPSPSGYWMASGDEEGNVLIWSYPGLKVKYEYKVLKTISDIDWDETSTRIVCGGDGMNKAKVISWDSGNTLGEITMHSLPIISVSYKKSRPYRIVTGSEDLAVNVYEGPPFKYKESYKGHTRYPNSVSFSPNGSLFVSAGADSRIVIFDSKDNSVKQEITDSNIIHKGAIYAMAWAPDSAHIITASADKTCKIWSVADGAVVSTFNIGQTTDDQQVGVVWTKKGKILSISLSGAINYLDKTDTPTGKITQVLHGHQSSIQSLVCDQVGGCIYTAGLTGEICEWAIKDGSYTGRWMTGRGHQGKVVSALTVGENGNTRVLFSYGLDDMMRINDLSSHSLSSDGVELGGLPVAAVTSSSDPQLCVVILAQEKAVIVRGGQVVSTTPLGFVPTALTFNNNETHLIIGGKDKKLHLYRFDRKQNKVIDTASTINLHDKPITAVQASPNGQFIVSTDKEASIYIHTCADDADNATAWPCVNKNGWRFHQAGIQDVCVRSNSKCIVTASLDHSIIIWNDLETFDPAQRTKLTAAHSQSVDGVKWWDDNTLISYSADKTIKIWTFVA